MADTRVFVYGTLTDPGRAGAVLDGLDYRGRAVLDGLCRVEGTYPTLAPGGSVEGRILATDDVAALDRYEGVDEGLYVRVSVPFVAGDGGGAGDDGTSADSATGGDTATDDAAVDADRTVETYVGDPGRLDAPAEWPGEGAFPQRVRAYLAKHAVVVRGG